MGGDPALWRQDEGSLRQRVAHHQQSYGTDGCDSSLANFEGCVVGVDVVIAHEADPLASWQLLDLAADVLLHDHLPAMAQIEHRLAVAGGSERLFTACERVLQHHEHAIRAERGLCLGGATTGRPGQRPNDSVRDLGGELSVADQAFGGHRAPTLWAGKWCPAASWHNKGVGATAPHPSRLQTPEDSPSHDSARRDRVYSWRW